MTMTVQELRDMAKDVIADMIGQACEAAEVDIGYLGIDKADLPKLQYYIRQYGRQICEDIGKEYRESI